VQFNPSKRPSANDGLRHPYVLQFHNPEDEFDCDRPIRIPIDDNIKLTVQDYRDRLYNEVLKKKKEQRRSHRRNLEMQQQHQQSQVVSQQQYAQHSSQSAHHAPAAQPVSSHSAGAHYGDRAHTPQQHGAPHSSTGARTSAPTGSTPQHRTSSSQSHGIPSGHQQAQHQYYGQPGGGGGSSSYANPQYQHYASGAQPRMGR
jgi:mitogen-activated protein kinase 15